MLRTEADDCHSATPAWPQLSGQAPAVVHGSSHTKKRMKAGWTCNVERQGVQNILHGPAVGMLWRAPIFHYAREGMHSNRCNMMSKAHSAEVCLLHNCNGNWTC